METHSHGNCGKHEDSRGQQFSIIVPAATAKKIEHAIEIENDLVSEQTVCMMFHKSKKTLSNNRCDGTIPKADYTIAFDKSRWYWLSKLLHIKNLFTKKASA